MLLKVIFCMLCLMFIPSTGFAYIDPGTSGFVFSFLGPLLAMVAGFLGIFFRPIWRGIKGFFNWGKQRLALFVIIITVLLLGLGAGVYYLFFFEEMSQGNIMTAKSAKKVIVLGLDGLDARIMERLMEAGDLPNFSRLKSQGSYARMESSNPSQSPVAWSCMILSGATLRIICLTWLSCISRKPLWGGRMSRCAGAAPSGNWPPPKAFPPRPSAGRLPSPPRTTAPGNWLAWECLISGAAWAIILTIPPARQPRMRRDGTR